MDFSVLLKDLRDVAEKYQGKSTEPQVSTHAYVDMFTKILKRAQKVTEQYDDQITVLWVALNQLASTYKDLTAGSARDQLCKFIFGMCAKTVLDIQWAQLDEDSKVKKNFSTTVEDVHKILSQLGFYKFQLIMNLMETHWTHPVLSKIMSGEEEDTEDCLEYIQKEDPDVLKLRIEIMMKENCEEFALNLCNWSLKHPALQNDLKIKEHQIFILYKQQEYGKMQEVCETIICHDGIKVMSHLAKTPSNQELCIRLAQVFLIQDWVKQERTCCTQELLKLWIHHQYLADKDEERFLDSIWTVAKVCRDTEQIGVLIDGVKKECGDMFIQLYSELCKFAINIDKGNMEREEVQRDQDEYNKRRLAMSKTCVRMAFMLKEYDFRISRICGLTAFSLDPTMDNLNLVNKLYWTMKNVSAASQNSKINIATLYEIERLLGQMRPEILNPEYSWKQLIPVCKKYKLDFENGRSCFPFIKREKTEHIPSQSSNIEVNNQLTPVPHLINVVRSDRNVTKDIDTGQKRGRKPKQKDVPKDIQKAHLAKLLGQKNLSRQEIERVLSKEFPRNVTQDFNDAPSLDVKELDKTINDLKKSIYLETQYRERIKNNLSSLQQCKKRSEVTDKGASDEQNEHVSRHEMFRQHQQMLYNKDSNIQRQHSVPGGSTARGPILHRQLSVGSPQPPNAHSHHRQQQMSPAFGGSPPPAHSPSPRLSSPTGFSSTLSPPGQRPHSVSSTLLNSRKSGAFSQIHTSQNNSGTVTQLCNKIQNELQQESHHSKLVKKFNILRPPGNSKQECAKIAQQIAEMHERQRAERERAEKLENARIQGQIDGVKAALNSRNIPSRSQISDLLSMTFQGNKGQKVDDGEENAIPSLQGTDMNHGKSYLKKKTERSASVSSVQNMASSEPLRKSSSSMQSPNATRFGNPPYSSKNHSPSPSNNLSASNRSHSTGRIPDVNHVISTEETDSSLLVPGEQGWDPARGILKQKYYYKSPTPKPKVNTGDTSLTMKPVYSMIVPKELTNPNRKEELVKTVTNMMKKFPKGINAQSKPETSSHQSATSPQTFVRMQSHSQTSPYQSPSTDVTRQKIHNNPNSLQGLSGLDAMQNNSSSLDDQSSFQPVLSVSSHTIAQNFLEDGLLNLNTLAAASVSVLGQNSNQQQLVGSLQLPQHVQQQQQVFRTPVIESQPMFSPIQSVQQVSVQQVVQQPETIIATPLYTMPTTVIPEPVLSQQIASMQSQVDLGLQQPVVQQIIAVQNQPVSMNTTQSFVNVVSQQPAFQVAAVDQVNFGGMTPAMTVGMSSSMSGEMSHVSGGLTNNMMEGIAQSITGGESHAVSGDVLQSKESSLVETSSSGRPPGPKQFLAAPELSPALVQQILSSLKKGGASSKRSVKSKAQDMKQAASIRPKQQSSVTSNKVCSVTESVKDSVQQMLLNRNDRMGNQSLNEAKQKILELRKQYGQTAVQQNLPDLSNASPNKSVPTIASDTVTSPRKVGGLLERLMSEDHKVGTSVQNLPAFLSPSQSDKCVNNLATHTAVQQSVPELVDLGAKEFQLDTILALDNEGNTAGENALQNNQFAPANKTINHPPAVVSQKEIRLKSVQGNVKVIEQSEPVIPATSISTDKVFSEKLRNSQNDQPLEHTSSQSTYFSANRLGKEREKREVKNQKSDFEEKKQTVRALQDVQTICANCDLQFPTEQHLIDHKKITNCEHKWQCSYCKMTFKCSEILKTHEKNYCLKAPYTMVRCCICGVYFQSHEQLKAHLNPKTCMPRNAHKEKTQLKEDIVCGICKRNFESMSLIKEHVKVGCVKKNNAYSKESSSNNCNFSVVFKCTKCNFMNLNENIVSKHVEKCKENNTGAELTEMYECNMCEQSFCVKEDACRHVLRQCSKLKVTNTQRQVQDVYQKMKDANISKVSTEESDKIVESKERISIESNKIRGQSNERTSEAKEISKTEKKDTSTKPSVGKSIGQKKDFAKVQQGPIEKKRKVKETGAEIRKPKEPIGKISEQSKQEDKTPTVCENKMKDQDVIKAVQSTEDKLEVTAEMQKVQRISAENRFFAEFNEIEKRKQAIRMKKQKELEKQKALLERKEREKELDLIRKKKMQELLEEEKERQKVFNQKHEREKDEFEIEKEKYVNSILGTSTLEQKMKESFDKEKKSKKIQNQKIKDETNNVLHKSKHDRKTANQEENRNLNNALVEPKKSESAASGNQQDEKEEIGYLTNRKKRKKEEDGDYEAEVLPQEKRVPKEHIETPERRMRKRDIFITRSTDRSRGRINRMQKSPQDIRKMKGLRAKRLIKKKKYYMDEMEPIHRDKYRKEDEQSDRSQNVIHGIKHKSHVKIKTEMKGRELEHSEKIKKPEKDRSLKEVNLIQTRNRTYSEKGESVFIQNEQVGRRRIDRQLINQTKEDISTYFRRNCRYCGLQSKRKSDKNLDVIYHYVQTHKLGFRQANYRYICNFCNQKFPSTQTKQVKDHVCHKHWEGVLRRVSAGKYDSKFEQTNVNNKSLSPNKTRCTFKVTLKTPVKLNKTKKHLRALALREKCAEKLREISLTHKNSVIDYTETDEDSSFQCSSDHSTDTETMSREERISNVSARIASISHGKKGERLGPESRDGRRIAPRLARQMVKGSSVKGTKACLNDNVKKTSDIDDTSDMQAVIRSRSSSSETQVITRSRSSSFSSNTSSLITSAKKRKAAIAISTKGSLRARQKQVEGAGKLLLTRSGRVVKRPEIDYDKLTESSGLGSGEDNSELEDSNIRKRKSTRIRRLSEKGKSLRHGTSDTDESSTDEVKRRVTRRSLSKGNENVSESRNIDEGSKIIEIKRIRTDHSPGSLLNNESVELRSSKKKCTGKAKEGVVKDERITTRQNSKNEDESDSETESNYTDIEHAVKMLGVRKIQNAAFRSAESDSESTSEENDNTDRKYRLRKRHSNKKYRESESSEEEVTNTKVRYKENDLDFESPERSKDPLEDTFRGEKRTKVEEGNVQRLWSEGSQEITGNISSRRISLDSEKDAEETVTKTEKPKVVLIGPEDDDDLNVDYTLCEGKQDFYSDSQEHNSSSENHGTYSEDEASSIIRQGDDISNKDDCGEIKERTVLLGPEDEFAGLESSPTKSHEREKSAESELYSESFSEVETEVESNTLPATVMDEDEFKFLKCGHMLNETEVGTKENYLNASASKSNKAAFDSEFIKYAETEAQEDDTDSDGDFPDIMKERVQLKQTGKIDLASEMEIPLLVEDVPVLPPRDFATDTKTSLKNIWKNSEVIEGKKKTKGVDSEETRNVTDGFEAFTAAEGPRSQEKSEVKILKSARVVIEDISIVRKAIEIENAEKKLIEECESSSCSVRIDRLSREDIEKHFPRPSNAYKKNEENDVVLIDDSDEGNVDIKPKVESPNEKENVQNKNQNKKIDESSRDVAQEEQYETLIQDIVLDGSFIDQLLIHESVNINVPGQEATNNRKAADDLESTECVQIVVENGNNLQGSLIAVDAKCDTSAEFDASYEITSNNVIILIDGNESDSVDKAQLDESESNKEIEEDVWIENAETYAETSKDAEICEKVANKFEIVKIDDMETSNTPDYSDLFEQSKENLDVVSSSLNDTSESSSSLNDTSESKQMETAEIKVISGGTSNKQTQEVDEVIEKMENAEVTMKDKADLPTSHGEMEYIEISLKHTADVENVTKDIIDSGTVNPIDEPEVRKQDFVLKSESDNEISLKLDTEGLQGQEIPLEGCIENELNPSVSTNEQDFKSQDNDQDDDTTKPQSNIADENKEHNTDNIEQSETSDEIQTEIKTGFDIRNESEANNVNTGNVVESLVSSIVNTQEQGNDKEEIAECSEYVPTERVIGNTINNSIPVGPPETLKETSSPENEKNLQNDLIEDTITNTNETMVSKHKEEKTDSKNIEPSEEIIGTDMKETETLIPVSKLEETKYCKEGMENTAYFSEEKSFVSLETQNKEIGVDKGSKHSVLDVPLVDSHSGFESIGDTLTRSSEQLQEKSLNNDSDHGVHDLEEEQCSESEKDFKNETTIQSPNDLCFEKFDQTVSLLEKAENDFEKDVISPEGDALLLDTEQTCSIARDGTKEESYSSNNLNVAEEKCENDVYHIINSADQPCVGEAESHSGGVEETSGIKSNNEQIYTENLNNGGMECESKVVMIEFNAEGPEVESMTSDLCTHVDNMNNTKKDECDAKLHVTGNENIDDTCVPTVKETEEPKSFTRPSPPLITNSQNATATAEILELFNDESTVEDTEVECISRSMQDNYTQEESISPAEHANSVLQDDSTIGNEKDFNEEKDNYDKRDSSFASSNSSLLAIQSYSDSDSEEDTGYVLKEINSAKNAENSACTEEVNQSEEQRELEPITKITHNVNVQEQEKGEGKSEQFQNKKLSEPNVAETSNVSELELFPENVELKCANTDENSEHSTATLLEENEVHKTACVETDNMHTSAQSYNVPISFDGVKVESDESSLQIEDSEITKEIPYSNEGMQIEDSEIIKEIPYSNGGMSETLTGACLCADIVENDRQYVNHSEPNVDEMKCSIALDSARTDDQVTDSSCDITNESSCLETVQVDSQSVRIGKQTLINMNVEDGISSDFEEYGHIQLVRELDEGVNTQKINEEIEYYKNIAEVSDKPVEKVDGNVEMDIKSHLSEKNETNFDELVSSNEKGLISVFGNAEPDKELSVVEETKVVTNLETSKGNILEAEYLESNEEKRSACCSIAANENRSFDNLLQSEINLNEEDLTEQEIKDSKKSDNEIVNPKPSAEKVPCSTQETHPFILEENVPVTLVIQKTFESVKEPVDELKEQRNVGLDYNLAARPANTENEVQSIQDESAEFSGIDQSMEKDGKNSKLKIVRQTSVSSSSDLSLISFPEYDTEHSEESNENKTTENIESTIKDEVSDQASVLTSQVGSIPDRMELLEQESILSKELADKNYLDFEKPVLENILCADSSNSPGITIENEIPEHVTEEAQAGISEVCRSCNDKIEGINTDENSMAYSNEYLEEVFSGVNLPLGETEKMKAVDIAVPEILPEAGPDISEDVFEQALGKVDECNFLVDDVNKEKAKEAILDFTDILKEPELLKSVTSEIPLASEDDSAVLGENLEGDKVESKNEDLTITDKDSSNNVEMESTEDPSIELHVKSDATKASCISEIAFKDTKTTEVVEEIGAVEKVEYSKEISSVADTMQPRKQSLETGSQHEDNRQRSDPLEDVDNKNESRESDHETIGDISNQGDGSIEHTSNDEKASLEIEEIAEQEVATAVLENCKIDNLTDVKEVSSKVMKTHFDNSNKNSVSIKQPGNSSSDLIETSVEINIQNSVYVKQAGNVICTSESEPITPEDTAEITKGKIDEEIKCEAVKDKNNTSSEQMVSEDPTKRTFITKSERKVDEEIKYETVTDQNTKETSVSGRESKVSKDEKESVTEFGGLEKIDEEKFEAGKDQNKKEINSQEIIETEEDPTLDKWVKDIISKETEDIREVFEMPSPRRRGMIVGATCIHKKPENPFVETRTHKKEGSPRKEINIGNQLAKNASKEVDEIKVNQKKNLQCPERSERKTVPPGVKKRGKAEVEMSQKSVRNNLKPKATQNDKKQSSSDSRNEVSHNLRFETAHREKKHVENSEEVGDKVYSSTNSQQKVKQVRLHSKRLCEKTDNHENVNIPQVPVDTRSVDIKTVKLKQAENCAKTQTVNTEINKKLTQTSQCQINQKKDNFMEKNTGLRNDKDGNCNEELQREDETDEEFTRRTETVRSARRKSAVKPYESDFNFEENANNTKVRDSKVTPSTSFWPSESENSVENFDTASLFSSSSESSTNTGGVKEGKLKVMARCARDFGKDDTVKQKIIQPPRTSAVPIFTCSSPEKTTVSTMAVKIVKTFGARVEKTVPSAVKYTRQQHPNPIIAAKIKVLDKNVIPSTSLPARIVKVSAFKSLPKVTKSVTITPRNIAMTLQKLTEQGKIKKHAPEVKTVNSPSIQKEKKSLNEVKKVNKNTEPSITEPADQNHQQKDFEPTDEKLSNKVKALRALHKNDKPFNWENSPSPPKKLRSQTKTGEIAKEVDTNKESISTVQESKSKPETRKSREKLLNQKPLANQKNLRESRKKGNDESSEKTYKKEDISGKKQTVLDGKKTKLREPHISEQGDVNIRRTRSRSGSKDKIKLTDEKNVTKQKQEVIVKSKKQVQGKLDTKHSSTKANLKTETKNATGSMKLRHCSESKKDEAEKPKVNAEMETAGNKECKTRVQKRKSEPETVEEPKHMTIEEPAAKVCKLDGTSNSPEKNEVPKCAHKLNIPGCDQCEEKQSGSQKFGKESVRPAVRQIIHKGRVFEIQRGCVTETDIQDFTRNPRSVLNEPTSTSGEDHVMKRSKRINNRRKRAHSPEEIVDINMKGKPTEMGVQDINKYISQTLRDIKKQRNSNSKWTVKQKRTTKDNFPYYFKKANSKL